MPLRLCLAPRCGSPATYRGRCRSHARDREAETHPNKSFYNSKRWLLTRRKQLFDHPLCACGAIATDVDHVTPIEEGGDKWDSTNLASLCASCHGRKTRAEQVGFRST